MSIGTRAGAFQTIHHAGSESAVGGAARRLATVSICVRHRMWYHQWQRVQYRIRCFSGW